MPFEDNLKARMDAGEHPTLYGYSDTLQKELTSVKEVAEFIYTEGLKGDVLITTSDASMDLAQQRMEYGGMRFF